MRKKPPDTVGMNDVSKKDICIYCNIIRCKSSHGYKREHKKII